MTAAAAPTAPFVSVIVPCRNERRYIAECLDSILGGAYPADRVEVLVADGMSDDGTREVLAEYAAREPRLHWFDNPARITPAALNAAVRRARGDVVVRMDAHCRYPRDYVARLVEWLERSGADNVGGVCVTRPAGDGARARAVARALAHPFGVGNAYFRIGVGEPRWVDTVPFGCYRRAVFERIGPWDEELVRNQDDELNHRLLRHGGRILLVPEIRSEYFARDSLGKLARMYYQYGHYKPLVVRKLGGVVTLRQLVPPLFVLGLALAPVLALLSPWLAWLAAVVGLLYVGAAVVAAAPAARTEGVACAAWLAAAFPVIHVSYGVGYLRGVVDFMLRRRERALDPSAVGVTR